MGIICGNALTELRKMDDCSVQCCVTSPLYWGLRDYGVEGQIGVEDTPGKFIDRLVDVFTEVRRVLRDDGTLWLNLGDSYVSGGGASHGYKDGRKNRSKRLRVAEVDGLPVKNLIGIPWRVAFALQADGWYLRQDNIWHKPNVMPESVTDRCTKAHEYVFLLSKRPTYYYDHEAIKEPAQDWGTRDRKAGSAFKDGVAGRSAQGGGTDCNFAESGRNKRSVWTIPPSPGLRLGLGDGDSESDAVTHFATFPVALVKPCILAGSPVGGIVLDPFFGAGTTGLVANRLGREYVSIELNPKYCELAKNRIYDDAPLFNELEN